MHLEWRWNSVDDVSMHRQIISYFGDTLSPQSPFSIQKLVSIGRESGKKAGDWYGPASIANVLWYGIFCFVDFQLRLQLQFVIIVIYFAQYIKRTKTFTVVSRHRARLPGS